MHTIFKIFSERTPYLSTSHRAIGAAPIPMPYTLSLNYIAKKKSRKALFFQPLRHMRRSDSAGTTGGA
jgi:hypothetical protein